MNAYSLKADVWLPIEGPKITILLECLLFRNQPNFKLTVIFNHFEWPLIMWQPRSAHTVGDDCSLKLVSTTGSLRDGVQFRSGKNYLNKQITKYHNLNQILKDHRLLDFNYLQPPYCWTALEIWEPGNQTDFLCLSITNDSNTRKSYLCKFSSIQNQVWPTIHVLYLNRDDKMHL